MKKRRGLMQIIICMLLAVCLASSVCTPLVVNAKQSTKASSTSTDQFKKSKRVVGIVKTKIDDETCHVAWKPFKGAIKYEFKVCINKSFKSKYKPTTIQLEENNLNIIKMKPKYKYYFKVRAIGKLNGKTVKSKWSKVHCVNPTKKY